MCLKGIRQWPRHFQSLPEIKTKQVLAGRYFHTVTEIVTVWGDRSSYCGWLQTFLSIYLILSGAKLWTLNSTDWIDKTDLSRKLGEKVPVCTKKGNLKKEGGGKIIEVVYVPFRNKWPLQ